VRTVQPRSRSSPATRPTPATRARSRPTRDSPTRSPARGSDTSTTARTVSACWRRCGRAVVFDQVLSILRRLAEEHHSVNRFRPRPPRLTAPKHKAAQSEPLLATAPQHDSRRGRHGPMSSHIHYRESETAGALNAAERCTHRVAARVSGDRPERVLPRRPGRTSDWPRVGPASCENHPSSLAWSPGSSVT
jgi:hypothetical protein